MKTARWRPSTILLGDTIYVLGGQSQTVERSTYSAIDGSLGGFDIVPDVALVTSRAGAVAIIVDNTVYIIGGALDGSVEQATLN